jgi:hypothetical protein
MQAYIGTEIMRKIKQYQEVKPRPGPGRPRTGKNAMIAIRWPKPLLEGIDRYARTQALTRPVALRQIVTKFLAKAKMIDLNAVI